MRTHKPCPTHPCGVDPCIGRAVTAAAGAADPRSCVPRCSARPRPGRAEAGHARREAVALLAAILVGALLLALAKDLDLSILPDLFPHFVAERLRHQDPQIDPLHEKDADAGGMYREKILFPALRLFDSDRVDPEKEEFVSVPDLEAEEVLYLEKALHADARTDALPEEHDQPGLYTEMFMPEFESSAVPSTLGTITVDSLDTVSVMVQRIYGTARGPYKELVAGANPEIEDLNTVVQGARLVFPALNPRRIKTPVEGYWLSLGRYATLEAAYRALAAAAQTGRGQWVLLSGFSPADGMYFKLLDPRAHAFQAAAQEAADGLSQALGMPVQVVAEWWGQSLFLTDQPAKGLAAASASGMDAGPAVPARPSVMDETSATEKQPVPDDPSVPAPPVPGEPAAPDEQPARTVPAAALPLRTLFGSTVPDSFHTGAPQQIYVLLAGGLIRDYALRDPGLHPDGNGRSQAGFVQVVAHARRDLADEEADRFLEHGWPAAVFSMDIQGRILHRVLIGPFASPQEALDVRALAQEAAAALDLVKTVMGRGRIEALEGPGEAGQIVLAADENAPQAAQALEALGWPVLEIKGQAVHIGPFPDKPSAMAYQQRALNGTGWGPRHDLLD